MEVGELSNKLMHNYATSGEDENNEYTPLDYVYTCIH